MFRVLSSVRVEVGGTDVRVASPGQRALLAQLLVNANQTVSAAKLIDGLWGDCPPQHPDSALHIVVCRLRRCLGPFAVRLVRDPSGYRMEVDPHELDLECARTFAADAHRALADGDYTQATASFNAALACWTGEPLADLAVFPFHDAAARSLRDFRISVVESRNAACLRSGGHLDVLRDIDTWIETEPWRERLRAHQMVALYRSGRQIEALAAYETLRQLLVTDFGVDPHEDLQRLHGRILRRDPALLDNRSDPQARVVPLPLRAVGSGSDGANRSGEIRLDRADVVMVEGGPGVERVWLVAEVPSGERDGAAGNGFDDAMRRMSLSDWLAESR
jgi:DNA-binding SARP family transcriptional activator